MSSQGFAVRWSPIGGCEHGPHRLHCCAVALGGIRGCRQGGFSQSRLHPLADWQENRVLLLRAKGRQSSLPSSKTSHSKLLLPITSKSVLKAVFENFTSCIFFIDFLKSRRGHRASHDSSGYGRSTRRMMRLPTEPSRGIRI